MGTVADDKKEPPKLIAGYSVRTLRTTLVRESPSLGDRRRKPFRGQEALAPKTPISFLTQKFGLVLSGDVGVAHAWMLLALRLAMAMVHEQAIQQESQE